MDLVGRISNAGAQPVLYLSGEIDLSTLPLLRDHLTRLVHEHPRATVRADLDGVTKPMCFIWGDQDHQLPADLAQKYRDVPARMKNAEVHIFPDVHHGYMLRGGKAFDQKTYDFSMQRAFALLETLRG